MKAKEKAKELVDSFYDVDDGIDFDNGWGITPQQVKGFALICIDEILDLDMLGFDEDKFNKHIEHWQQVKQEINKL
ncbi:hypothetical protein B617_gp29 [Nonlabens phage P12024S]|uniref:Uncharacterized protein n=1 Tax=Nonlabens phage P12024S TaxID=1168478 RepID=I6S6M8_9CAUD|nr:hypothetical protein B617_gp29 [Nonlabens phage P12024S]AFM54690.1 hypothetical protein P12024S_29 [Nonlabens phage P12024S]